MATTKKYVAPTHSPYPPPQAGDGGIPSNSQAVFEWWSVDGTSAPKGYIPVPLQTPSSRKEGEFTLTVDDPASRPATGTGSVPKQTGVRKTTTAARPTARRTSAAKPAAKPVQARYIQGAKGADGRSLKGVGKAGAAGKSTSGTKGASNAGKASTGRSGTSGGSGTKGRSGTSGTSGKQGSSGKKGSVKIGGR